MKQPDSFTRFWVNSMSLGAFVTVAPGAGVAKVVRRVDAPFALGLDVLDMHLSTADLLGGAAIFTAILRPLRNKSPH